MLFPLFAISVDGTGGKLTADVINTGGNLPPVMLTPVANFPSVSKTPEVSLIPVANLPPVSLIPVVHLALQISPRISENIRNDPNVFLGAWGKMIQEKNLKQKIS
jgi:hypothetical protein